VATRPVAARSSCSDSRGISFPTWLYLEYFAGAVYPSRPTELARYWDILNQLATQADPPIASTLTIEQLRREL